MKHPVEPFEREIRGDWEHRQIVGEVVNAPVILSVTAISAVTIFGTRLYGLEFLGEMIQATLAGAACYVGVRIGIDWVHEWRQWRQVKPYAVNRKRA